MKKLLMSATRFLAMAGSLAALSLSAQGAGLMTLGGTAPDARQESDAEVRLSLLSWTSAEQEDAIVAEYERYAGTQDHTAFQNFLQQQETKGYLFTKAASGYSIKYAWQDEGGAGKEVVLLVTPALKTRNPYLWKNPNQEPAPFSLVELHFDGEEATAKSSSGAVIEVSPEGHLQLQDFESAETFATMQNVTLGYLKTPS